MRARHALLVLAGAAYFVAAVAWIGHERRGSVASVFAPGSIYNTSDDGASLAYGYLAGRPGARVAMLNEAIATTALPQDAVVFRVRPWPFARHFDDREANARPASARLLSAGEEDFVRAGGRLVLAWQDSYGPAQTRRVGAGDVRKVYPLWPGVSRLASDPPRVISTTGLIEANAVFVSGEAPLVASAGLGRGDVVLIAVPEILTNGGLGLGDHLSLLEALAGRGRPVYFDEASHGLGNNSGLLDGMLDFGLGPALALGALASLLAFWRARSRLGLPDTRPRETRSDAVDLVESLGGLYQRALTPAAALALYEDHLVRAVGARTGLRGDALRNRVRELLRAAGGTAAPVAVSEDGFKRRLATLCDAFRRLSHAQPR